MGVSAEAANIDLVAVVAGGDSFIARMKELQAAKEAVQASFDNLKLGNDAAAAYADAQKNQQVAKQAIADAQEAVEAMLGKARVQAEQIVGEAARAAEQIASDSATKLAAFNRDLDGARKTLNDWSDQTRQQAGDIAALAQRKLAQAETMLSEAKTRSDDLAAVRLELDRQLGAAKLAEETLNAKLAAIRAASQ